jgi:hypothetical protein
MANLLLALSGDGKADADSANNGTVVTGKSAPSVFASIALPSYSQSQVRTAAAPKSPKCGGLIA